MRVPLSTHFKASHFKGAAVVSDMISNKLGYKSEDRGSCQYILKVNVKVKRHYSLPLCSINLPYTV